MENNMDKLRNSEKRVANYILNNSSAVIYQSISELAENAATSDPTVIRFCRSLGFKGFQDLKIQLAKGVVSSKKNIHEEAGAEDSVEDVIRKVFAANISAINNTLEILEPEAVEKAIDALVKAEKIEFYGLGGSGPEAMDAYHKFFKIGIPCAWYNDPHMQAMSAALLTANTVAFAISHTGSSKDIVESLTIAKEHEATTIALVSHLKSPVAKVADITLCVHSRETKYKPEPMSSRIAHLCVIDVLSVGVSLRKSDKFLESISKTRKALINKKY
ncbi:MAG: MurR/RpiR family transcriptional regulator [Bacillota bacterium]